MGLLLALAFAAGLAVQAKTDTETVRRLDEAHTTLRNDFGESRGRARLLAILSPT